MLDFSLSQDQKTLQLKARDFTESFILPRTDLDTHGHFPMDLYEKGFDAGFVTGPIPLEYGGGGRSLFEMILVAEEIAYGDLGVATSMLLLKLATGSVLNFGTESQKRKWITPLTKELKFASHAWSEPEGSSNLMGRPASTTATPVEGGFLLNGVKTTISNASVASMYTVFARIHPAPQNLDSNLSTFLVARDSSGVSVSDPYKKMGQRAADTAEVTFKNVFIPYEDQIGEIGRGVQIGLKAIRASRVGVAAAAVGVARRARDLAKIYGHSRKTGDGSLLIQQQDYKLKLAQIEAEIEMVRALAWRACYEVESNGSEVTKLTSAAKLMGGDLAVRVTNDVSEMLGASGYLESGLIEKLIRDSKVLQIYEGTGVIQKMLIADTATRLGRLKIK